jgi:predicted nucleotidyltransferase
MSSTPHDLLGMVLRGFGRPVVSVTMFGSRVKGDAGPNSDYDMIIIMEQLDPNPNVREELAASAIANILLESGFRISPLVLTREEATNEVENGSPLFASVLSNYKILYDPSGFMAELLDLTKRSCPNITYVERGRAWNLARTV